MLLLTDGHHNRLLRVGLDGDITELAAFPNVVPTGIPTGDRSVYVAVRIHQVTGGGGVQLHVEETGNPSGQQVLFIHGLSQTRLAWNQQLHIELTRDLRLVALDLRAVTANRSDPPTRTEIPTCGRRTWPR